MISKIISFGTFFLHGIPVKEAYKNLSPITNLAEGFISKKYSYQKLEDHGELAQPSHQNRIQYNNNSSSPEIRIDGIYKITYQNNASKNKFEDLYKSLSDKARSTSIFSVILAGGSFVLKLKGPTILLNSSLFNLALNISMLVSIIFAAIGLYRMREANSLLGKNIPNEAAVLANRVLSERSTFYQKTFDALAPSKGFADYTILDLVSKFVSSAEKEICFLRTLYKDLNSNLSLSIFYCQVESPQQRQLIEDILANPCTTELQAVKKYLSDSLALPWIEKQANAIPVLTPFPAQSFFTEHLNKLKKLPYYDQIRNLTPDNKEALLSRLKHYLEGLQKNSEIPLNPCKEVVQESQQKFAKAFISLVEITPAPVPPATMKEFKDLLPVK